MVKKVLAGLLAAAMMVSMIGCGNAGKESEEMTKNSSAVSESGKKAEDVSFPLEEEVTFTISGPYGAGATADWESTVQFQEYKKRLGINLKASTYDSETWKTQLSLMLAEDNLPDIIAGAEIQPGDMAKYAQDGYFLDFSKYLDKMPNLSAFLEKYPEYKAAITLDDGGIYGFTKISTYCDSAYSSPSYMNGAWLDRLGLKRPETVEDFYDVLKAFKEQDANGNGDATDEIPMLMAMPTWIHTLSPIRWAYGIYECGQVVYWEQVDENGKVQLMDASENAREFFRFAHKLYTEGLINQDAFSMEDSVYFELAASDNVGYVGGYQPSVDLENQARNQWYLMGGLTAEGWNEEPVLVVENRISPTYRVMVNADVENVDAVVKFIDYLFTEEGATSAINGYEGLSFDYVDVCGFPSADHTAYATGYGSPEEYRKQVAVADSALYIVGISGFWNMIENIDEDKLLSDDVLKVASVNAIQEKTFRSGEYKVIHKFPNLKYSNEIAEERTMLRTDLVNYLKTTCAQFIAGELDVDKDWDAYLAQLESIGLSRFLEIEQEAYDSYIANY